MRIRIPLKHQDRVRMSRHIRMHSHSEAELIFFAVEIVKVIPPQVFHIPRIYPSVRVRRFLNEHHRWQIIQVPIGWYLHKPCLLTSLERMHPVRRVLRVVDGRPRIADTEVVGVAIVVGERVVCRRRVR